MSDQRPQTADNRSTSSSVEVPVGASTAFAAFTEEVDLWWVRGPINHHAPGRVVAMRIEPGVGGRLLEVYDEAEDALELARITAWEPGKRLAWQSSLDDVETEVDFEASDTGTTVRVTARIPIDGKDRGGTSWVRVVPKWFGPWCGSRDDQRRHVRDLARLALAISYSKPAAAARWLADSFGFTSPDPLPEGLDPLPDGPYGHPWIEFRLGNSSLMIFRIDGDRQEASGTHVPWVYVDEIETHFQRSKAANVTIVEPLASPWGLPFYVAADPEGNHWTFAQARPTME